MNDYNDYLRSENKSERTIASYNQALKKFFEYLNIHFNLDGMKEYKKIDRKIIKEYLVYQNKKGLASSTLNQTLYAIKSYFAWLCEDMSLIENNPAVQIRAVKVPYRQSESCSIEDIQKIFAYIKKRNGLRNKAILSIAVICGLRCEELVNLDLDDYYVENGFDFIHIIGKGNKERTVVLSPNCAEILREYMLERKNEKTACKALFLSEKTKNRMGTHAIYDLICEIRDRCGVYFYPHKLRHTAGSEMYAETKDIAAVQEVLGHSNIQTTRRYIHIPTSRLQSAINDNPLNKVIG